MNQALITDLKNTISRLYGSFEASASIPEIMLYHFFSLYFSFLLKIFNYLANSFVL
jgi:hypothetical protein